jgi:hypothetical protein
MSVLIALTGVVANAGVNTTELGMTLTVDLAGNGSVRSTVGALEVDAYEIWSTGAQLDPIGWESIADAASVVLSPRWSQVLTELGAGALSFGELVGNSGLMAEGSLTGAAVFTALPWTIGTPLAAVLDAPGVYHAEGNEIDGDVRFYYTKPSDPGNKYLGIVEIVPEPATMSLLIVGGLGVLARRRRR